VLSGEGVEGRHVEHISCVLEVELGVRVGGRGRGVVGPVWVGEIAHRTGEMQKEEERETGRDKRLKVNVE
jgi:hypothetical protein